jgi:hypothetical protein
VDWKVDQDWDRRSAADDSPGQPHELWQDAVTRSLAVVTEALASLTAADPS